MLIFLLILNQTFKLTVMFLKKNIAFKILTNFHFVEAFLQQV